MDPIRGLYSPDRVKALFDRMSGSYERMNYITSFGFSIRWRRQFLRHVPQLSGRVVVMDLMTGMGETWAGIHDRFRDVELWGLDFSAAMLGRAELRNRKHFNGSVRLCKEDILRNHLPSAQFDVVYCAFGLKTFNTEQLRTLAKETKRILKPGGRFSFVEVSRPDNMVLGVLYRLHLKYIVPLVGSILLGGPDEYRMLWRYTKNYGNSRSAAETFAAQGLTVTLDRYFFGCATGFHGYS